MPKLDYDTIYPTGYRLLHPNEVRLLQKGDVIRKWGQTHTVIETYFATDNLSPVHDRVRLEIRGAEYNFCVHPDSDWWTDVYAKFPRRDKKGEG